MIYSYVSKILLTHPKNCWNLKKYICKATRYKTNIQGFPCGSVVKNLPANAGDKGSIPDPGRSHMLLGN